MALSSHALTTVSTVQEELGLADADADVGYLTRLINAASRRIEQFCNRHFEYGSAVADTLPGHGMTRLLLSRAPIVSLTSVTYDGATVSTSDIKILDGGEPGILYRASGWVWGASTLANITEDLIPGTEDPLYVVTYAGGYVTPNQATAALARTLPEDLEDSCIQLVASRFRGKGRDQGIKAEKLMQWSASYGSFGIPESIQSDLMPYRRVAMA